MKPLKAVIAAALVLPTPAVPATPGFRAYVDARWGQMHGRVAGPAFGPVVILVHKMVWSSVEFSR
jgi:hypothetical protein